VPQPARGIAVKKFFNWILVLGALVGAFYGIGLIVPRNQVQGSKTTLTTSPRDIIKVLADPSTYSDWNPEVSSAQEKSGRGDDRVWLVTDKQARSYEMEVKVEEDRIFSWQGTYAVEDTRIVLRFDIRWSGQGAQVNVTRTVDTRDAWRRARRFLLPTGESSALALLNSLAEHLGEPGSAKEN
jgi:hypothetical protein